MRQRIVRVAVVAVMAALIMFAVPLAVVVRSSLFSEERRELERAALQAAARVGPEFATGDPVELPVDQTRTIGLYDSTLHLRAGLGPANGDSVVAQAATGSLADAEIGDNLVVAVPVTASEAVVGVVRAAIPTRVVWYSVFLAWLVLAALAAVALTVAVLVARRQSGLLSEPLESLSETSQRVADGDLTARAELSGIPEIQRVADTQNAMVGRLAELLEREHHFSADASHQLRTLLAGLELGLENALSQARHTDFDARAALIEATEGVQELHRTVEDLLQIARLRPDQRLTAEPAPIESVLVETERRWHGPLAREGRRLTVQLDPDLKTAAVPERAVVQALNILVDNALRHGTGTVTITGRGIGDTVAVDVSDEGSVALNPRTLFERGSPDNAGHGIGLALARSIAEACGGRLQLATTSPTRLSLLLPQVETGPQTSPSFRVLSQE